MKLAGVAVLSAIVLGAGDPSRVAVPSSPDLTIRTRLVHGGGPSRTEMTVRLKGARQSREHAIAAGPGPLVVVWGPQIAQCDRQRIVVVHHPTKTYAEMPTEDSGPGVVRAVVASALWGGAERDLPVTERIIIDAVDTGERRRFGPLTARHVITTTTTEQTQGSPRRSASRVQDGWYVDLPPPTCGEEAGEFVAIGRASGPGDPPGRTEIVRRGTARSGFALIEVDRTDLAGHRGTQSTELIEISERPLDDSLFEAPRGYRPALRLWSGGFDFTRPDTAANRALLLFEGARDFVSALWR